MDIDRLSEIEALLEAMPLATALLDPDGIVIRANAALGRLTGLDPLAARGHSLFVDLLDPEEAEQVQSTFRVDVSRERRMRAYVVACVDGDQSEKGSLVDMRLRPVDLHGRQCGLATFEPLVGRRAQNETRTREVARVRHEIGNCLMGLVGNAELLALERTLPAELRPRVNAIFSESRRIHEQLNELARLSES